MPDWYGITGRDDLVGGSGETQFSTTIDDITLCSVEPFTDEEIAALREYFALLKANRAAAAIPPPPPVCDHCPHPPHNGLCFICTDPEDGPNQRCACTGRPREKFARDYLIHT